MNCRKFVICVAFGILISSASIADRGIAARLGAFSTLLADYLDTVAKRVAPQLEELEIGSKDTEEIVGEIAVSVSGCVLSGLEELTFSNGSNILPVLAASKTVADAIDTLRQEIGEEAISAFSERLDRLEGRCLLDKLKKWKLE